jgi:AraC-like DNA-binding protein
MKYTSQQTGGVKRPRTEFLERFLGNEAVTSGIKNYTISRGLQLYLAEVELCPMRDEPEERAYLNFYPVADGKAYLQLSFFPECRPASATQYRVVQLVFQPEFFKQWPQTLVCSKQPFRCDRSAEQAFSLNQNGSEALDLIVQTTETNDDFVQCIRRQEAALLLLRYALEAYMVPDEANKLPACSFLSNTGERDKVLETRRIILDNLEHPLTIRELSREVGMNECYLKKGFKAMFGKTIHEYQQRERIDRAKELLLEGKYSINEVAFKMGFGSASHFSTSFKKIAGMKPCELLR